MYSQDSQTICNDIFKQIQGAPKDPNKVTEKYNRFFVPYQPPAVENHFSTFAGIATPLDLCLMGQ